MADRRCATPGCTGTLPAGTGTHCPRCGGTEFLPRRGRSAMKILVLLTVLIGVGLVTALVVGRRSVLPPTGTDADRQALVDAKDIADKMVVFTARDDAYTDIVRRALAKHDFEYACKVTESIAGSVNRDQALRLIVDDALRQRQFAWAKHAAENMMMSTERDKALRSVMDASRGG